MNTLTVLVYVGPGVGYSAEPLWSLLASLLSRALLIAPILVTAVVGAAVALVGLPTAAEAVRELFRPAPLDHLPPGPRRFGRPDPATCTGPFGSRT